METSTTATTVIELQELLNADSSAVQQCVHALQHRGWILVRLPSSLQLQATATGTCLQAFFEATDAKKMERERRRRTMGPPPDDDERFHLKTAHPLLGYDRVGKNRQALRILTGSELSSQKMPKDSKEELTSLGMTVDAALWTISDVLSEPLFGMSSTEELTSIVQPELPFFHSSVTKPNDTHYALMEAAYYRNKRSSRSDDQKQEHDEPPPLCAAHYDPGLFSLNVLSTELGLQFQCENSKWHDIQPSAGYGVLWTGAAATVIAKQQQQQQVSVSTVSGMGSPVLSVAAGIHRVVLPPKNGKKKNPRLSIWSEICTKDQIFFEGAFGNMVEVQGNKICVFNILPIAGGEPYVVPIQKGSILETLRLVQQLKGLPMSKVMRTPVYNNEGEVVDIA